MFGTNLERRVLITTFQGLSIQVGIAALKQVDRPFNLKCRLDSEFFHIGVASSLVDFFLKCRGKLEGTKKTPSILVYKFESIQRVASFATCRSTRRYHVHAVNCLRSGARTV
jgi:hypothetical protein